MFASYTWAACDDTSIYDVDIPPQNTADALLELALQTKSQIIFEEGLGALSSSSPVVGRMSVLDALDGLILGSELQYLCGDGIIVITAAPQVEVEIEVIDNITESFDEDDRIEYVRVYGGLRDSLTLSSEKKRLSDIIIDVITSEEIGVLPGRSIAESLVQIPGVAGSRNDNGVITKIAIRGAENLALATFNGRELASSLEGRSIDFGLFTEEAVANVTVSKSATADMIEGGLSGTINIETLKPLDAIQNKLTISAEQTYTDGGQEAFFTGPWGGRLAATYIDNISDDLGFMVSARQSRETTVRLGAFSPFSWIPLNANRDRENDYDRDGTVGDEFLPTGGETREEGGKEDKTSFFTAIQWRPSDDIELNFDLYTARTDADNRAQNQLYLGYFDLAPAFFSDAQFAGNDFFAGSVIVEPEHAQATRQELNSNNRALATGINLTYTEASTKITSDLAFSSASSNQAVKESTVILSESSNTFDFNFYGNNPYLRSAIDTTNPGLWTPTGSIGLSAFSNKIEDQIVSYRFDVESDGFVDLGFLSIDGIKYGTRLSRRKKSNFAPTTRTSGSKSFAEIGCCDVNATSLNDNFVEGIVQPRNGPAYIVWSLERLAGRFLGGFDKPEETVDGRNSELTNSWFIKEFSFAFYSQWYFSGELFPSVFDDIPFSGSFGIRSVGTELDSRGWTLRTTDALGFARERNVGQDVRENLLNLNVDFEVSHDEKVRFSIARLVNRLPLDDLRASEIIDTNLVENISQGRSGNPDLKPINAVQTTLSYEYYRDDSSNYSVSLHYSELDSFIDTVVVDERTANRLLRITRLDNGKGGYVRGLEFAATHFFDDLDSPFNGVGIRANYAFTQTNISPQQQQGVRLIGLSKHVANISTWWVGEQTEFRVGWDYRSEYTDEDLFGNFVSVDETLTLDSRLSYRFNDHFLLSFDVANITNRPRRKFQGNVRDRSLFNAKNGRVYSLRGLLKF